MAFFDDFKLVRIKNGYSIKYCDTTLMHIFSKTFVTVFKDYASQKFINDIAKVATWNVKDDVSHDLASKLEKYYTISKREYFGNKRIKRVDRNSNEYQHFIKASKIVQNHNVSVRDYLNAQLEGLAFVNDGAGTYPKPSQLATSGAEDRLIVHMSGNNKKAKESELKRIGLTNHDRESELKSNPKFMDKYNKIKDASATLQDAWYVHDCMMVRKNYVTPMVADYIKKLEKGKSSSGS